MDVNSLISAWIWLIIEDFSFWDKELLILTTRFWHDHRISTYTGASSSQLSAMTSVYTEGNTGAYSPFQRFALEAPVHSHLSTKEERASAFPGFPVLEGNRTLFPVSTLFPLA